MPIGTADLYEMNLFLALMMVANAMLTVFKRSPLAIAAGRDTPSQKKAGTTMKADPTPAIARKVVSPKTTIAAVASLDTAQIDSIERMLEMSLRAERTLETR